MVRFNVLVIKNKRASWHTVEAMNYNDAWRKGYKYGKVIQVDEVETEKERAMGRMY